MTKLLMTENYTEMIEKDVLEQINFINLLDDEDRSVVENLLDLPKKVSLELTNVKDLKFLYHPIFDYIDDSQLVKDFFLFKDKNLADLQQSLLIEIKKSFIVESLRENDSESVIKGINNILNTKLEEIVYDDQNEDDYSIEQMTKRYRKSLNIINGLKDIEISSKDSEKIIFEIPIEENKKFFKDVSEKDSHFVKLKKPYWTSVSSGQYCFLNLFGRINAAISDKKKNDHILTLILIDEVDLGLHPAWQRKWMKHVPIILSKIFKGTPIQLVISTHSPVILSDVLDQDVHLIGSNTLDQGVCDFKTFGNNIHELMANQFFLDEGVIGDFAKNRINTIIEELKGQKIEEEELNEYEIIAEAIGEPVIKKEINRLLLENRELNLGTDIDKEYDKDFDDFKSFIKDIKNELKSTVLDEKENDLNEKDRN
ncbi:AAA family ATPase [Enterococcus avium]|uniref:AAA family ATPase n=1 Tax=Enterococcus avium TaxID=33945 RepID=UPI001157E196|nr:AAA family ATPase [Enterococcus avium]MDT2395791.1 AAA family ATPase [Enterococcus avium]MDT2420204.1 AAA family ATPase [Enterococcus avium]MDT2433156.1 AAA family ATPase [Enterococcus avium]MDT2442069.1 AAA family ATPase [Enterococcus avium]MDT2454995.1 AAA family ATPase [Enterococcus avium]